MCQTASALASIPRELMLYFNSKFKRYITFGINWSSTIIIEKIEGFFDFENLINSDKLTGVCSGVKAGQSASVLFGH